ncbi:pantoate--beta-alanine ligase [Virgibacillus sp. C22-A2]|uniref:Pantothenate synthetase n=1 Tax=Virgibacillus tibetensis TaxID=3042313 RepID=A0ABU6KAX8_9BACI|nr:pantoate--beta-alanine ligase [Virgibacillus sp. C22-A2]
MEVIYSIELMQQKSDEWVRKNKRIGFVATMGFFHEGHTHLMKEARQQNDIVITSIFVNPLQFGPHEDYDRYPRDERHDTLLAEQAGVDILFLPDVEEMYPRPMQVSMSITDRVNVLCGKSRPGHFDGVITVLTKLFNMTRPNRVYFGMKDAQQVAVVDALIRNLNFPIELIGLPTIREVDGLAKSSRNVFLSSVERDEAIWIFKSLKEARQLVVDGEKNPAIIVKEVADTITRRTSGKIDYVELLSYPHLTPVSVIEQQVIVAVAVQFEHTRLIDNLLFDASGKLIEGIK